mmetsp:Transcript_13663/g.39812  ORF Transcript_13663/g.39812 Transcript_13663/m.39812 type:complete len:236 (-) Transcript_13663:646-1353(-)
MNGTCDGVAAPGCETAMPSGAASSGGSAHLGCPPTWTGSTTASATHNHADCCGHAFHHLHHFCRGVCTGTEIGTRIGIEIDGRGHECVSSAGRRCGFVFGPGRPSARPKGSGACGGLAGGQAICPYCGCGGVGHGGSDLAPSQSHEFRPSLWRDAPLPHHCHAGRPCRFQAWHRPQPPQVLLSPPPPLLLPSLQRLRRPRGHPRHDSSEEGSCLHLPGATAWASAEGQYRTSSRW